MRDLIGYNLNTDCGIWPGRDDSAIGLSEEQPTNLLPNLTAALFRSHRSSRLRLPRKGSKCKEAQQAAILEMF